MRREVLEIDDAALRREQQEVVEQRDQQRLVGFLPEDPLEHEVSFGVGEDGAHAERVCDR